MEQALKVKMLGEFSISLGEVKVGGNDRSRKVWGLLAYLVFHRDRVVTQNELTRVLWDNEKENSDGNLKATIWRAKQMLEPLGKTISKESIIRERDGYRWNPALNTEVDREEFEAILRRSESCEDEESRFALYREALDLYQGALLGRLSTEPWVVPVAAYYHTLYIDALLEYLPHLLERQCYEETEARCQMAIQTDPYRETLHQVLMRSLIGRQQFARAVEAYTSLRDALFTELGISPESATQEIYHEALRNINSYMLSPDEIQSRLREEGAGSGAILCEFSLFQRFYQAEARAMARRGDAVHIGIFSMTDRAGKELSKRSLERAMENLCVQIQQGLRRSDIVARCSPSQFVILLLQANYENSCMVCERTIQAFVRAHPRSPARVRYAVFPLEPLGANGKSLV